jgi:hypothetical protein
MNATIEQSQSSETDSLILYKVKLLYSEMCVTGRIRKAV